MRASRLISGAVTVMVAASLFAGANAVAAPATDAGSSLSFPKPPHRIEVIKSGVVPRESVPGSIRPVGIFLRVRANRPGTASVRIRQRGSKRTVRDLGRIRVTTRPKWRRVNWDGRTARGRLAPAGRYVVVVDPAGRGPDRRTASFRLHGHVHPIAGPHGTRGGVGEFGAGRNGGRVHEGFDATARCGTPLVAVRSGRILKVANDPALKGYYVVLKGEAERRTYLYAHLRRPAAVRKGQRVRAGRRLGAVGQTGNAASTPCHLHFEIRTRGRLLDPWPILNSWEW
ncbi:MAG: M23 family metallopeptidase [Actinomycetota bacterium]|nr:M23 family metallopeptidase [Actinomycetota bacterium]